MSRFAGLLAAAAVLLAAALGASGIKARSDRERVISLYNIHTKETLTVLYKKDGKYVPSAMTKVNWILRDWRRDEATSMDPGLIDLLWELHSELGSNEPIHVISGYRSRATNNMLRKTVGGQASQSRHILGKAADVQFPDVPIRTLRYSAMIRERGGVGYYPTSALPFVHVDTDRVRAWPRLPRYELALLFPQGHTRHLPTQGGPITLQDVRIARAQHKDLVRKVAEFRNWRGQPRPAIAAVNPGPAPDRTRTAALNAKLIEAPRPASDPRRLSPASPSDQDRARLDQLASLATLGPRLVAGPTLVSRGSTPAALPSLTGKGMRAPDTRGRRRAGGQTAGTRIAAVDPAAGLGSSTLTDDPVGRFGWGSGWIAAPAYDDEHPEELSYRPFPIGPLLTASLEEPLLADLVHHDVGRTLDMLDQPGTILPLRFRPGEQTARLMWAHQFRGSAIGLSRIFDAGRLETAAGLQSRHVRTTGR